MWGKVYAATAFTIYSAITYHGFKHQEPETLALAMPVAVLWPVFVPAAVAIAVDYHEYKQRENT